MADVTCYIRRTKEWNEQYVFSDQWVGFWRADYLAQVWDSTFTMPYRTFRRRLRELQEQNFVDVGFARIINQYEYYPDHSLVVPTDDDDWFHPDVVRAVKDSTGPVYWNFVQFTEGTAFIIDARQHKMPNGNPLPYETNNYALPAPLDQNLLRDHVHASRNIQTGRHIDGCYSVHNRSLASLSLLRHHLLDCPKPQEELRRMHDICCQQPSIASDVPPYFAKLFTQMVSLYQDDLKARSH
jgi:hypothetical protein